MWLLPRRAATAEAAAAAVATAPPGPLLGQLHLATSWVRCRTARRLHLLGALRPWRALASLECVNSSKREEEAQRKKKDM